MQNSTFSKQILELFGWGAKEDILEVKDLLEESLANQEEEMRKI